MSKKTNNIAAVKLLDHGLKGMEIKHAVKRKDKDNREWLDEDIKKSKMPVDRAMKDLFANGKKFLYEIMGFQKTVNARITGIISNGKHVQLTAVVECIHGREIGFSTAIITEHDASGYDNYYSLLEWIDRVYEQVVVYMSGKTAIDNKQYVLALAETDAGAKKLEKSGVDLSNLESMNEQEAKAIATKFLEDRGAIVMHEEPQDELADDELFSDDDAEAENQPFQVVGKTA